MKPGVLLTDAHARSTVGTCECLARHGFRVGAATSDPPAPGQWSRRVSARLRVCDPREDPRRFAGEVAEAAAAGDFAAVLPGSDASVLAISDHRDLFDDRVHHGLPDRDAVNRAVNKLTMLDDAAAAGLAPPPSFACADPSEATAIAEQLGYPVLLKPRQTAFEHEGTVRQRQTFVAVDERSLLEKLPEFGLPCLLQRFDRGSLCSFAGVAIEGRLLAVTFSRDLRTWPADAGSLSFARTESASPDLVGRVSALVESLGWQGILHLEMIEGDVGRFAAIDFNPRLYGCIALATGAGAAIPAVWCRWLLERSSEETPAKPGVYYRWEEAEVRNLLLRLRSGRLRDALAVIRPRRPLTRAYLRWSDPLPALVMLARMVKSRREDRRLARAERRAAVSAPRRGGAAP
jgi:predicted ATP-grasp superfamily ATP-dependent carboligase